MLDEGSVGSNPTFSAKSLENHDISRLFLIMRYAVVGFVFVGIYLCINHSIVHIIV